LPVEDALVLGMKMSCADFPIVVRVGGRKVQKNNLLQEEKPVKRSILGSLIVLTCVAVSIAAAPPLTFTFSDVIATKTALETDSYAINDFGTIAGDYIDSAGVQHGMLLGRKTIPFEYSKCTGGGIAAFGINKSCSVAGWCINSSGTPIGWVRSKAGKFTDVNFPKGTGTEATGINDQGDVAGLYFDSAGVQHGFFKLKGGNYTTVDVKGAVSTAGWAINNAQVVTLEVINSSGLFDSYTYAVKTKKVTKINVPGAAQSIVHTNNDKGDIVYTIFDSSNGGHGVLFHAGNYTQFDDPKANNSTRGDGLNDALVIDGRYTPSSGGNFGFKAVVK